MVSQDSRTALKVGSLRKITGQLVRYVIVGGGTYVVDFLMFLAIVSLAPTFYLQANVAGRIAGASVGFVLHKYWTFGGNNVRSGQVQAVSYLALLTFNILFSSALLFGLISLFQHLSPVIARVITDVIVISFTFVCSRMIFK